jgi:large subunit ribosomal protein L21
MTYAIIETGGKQLRVEAGRFYDVERLAVDEDDKVILDKVLFVEHDGEVSLGQPLVEEATVEATVLRHLRGRKIIVYKMRPKKKTRKKQGHRQELTRIMIDAILLGGETLAGESEGVSDSAPTAEVEDVIPATESESVEATAGAAVKSSDPEEAPVDETAADEE